MNFIKKLRIWFVYLEYFIWIIVYYRVVKMLFKLDLGNIVF